MNKKNSNVRAFNFLILLVIFGFLLSIFLSESEIQIIILVFLIIGWSLLAIKINKGDKEDE